ncbi:MAG TPA: Rid family detoxifying hydrolase [Rectinemataceae bacterium]
MSKTCSTIPGAPAALGPYSHAASARGFAFLSGQLGLDPSTNALVPGGAAAEAAQSLANIAHVLKGLGLSMADVVKSTIFLRNMEDFQAVNAVYAQAFGKDFPARSAVQVAALPKLAAVEIEVIAAYPEA